MALVNTLNDFENWLEQLLERLNIDRQRALDRGDTVVAEALSRRIDGVHHSKLEIAAYNSECDLGHWQGKQ